MNKVIYKVDAFSEVEGGGNPAGVVPNAEGLTTEQMQEIAKVVNLSETAFVLKGEESYDYEVRFFTPTEEVDLCGHATIATFSSLLSTGIIVNDTTELIQKTKAGLLEIKLSGDGVLMRQAKPAKINKNIPYHGLYKAMGIDETSVGIDEIMALPEIWSTGLEDILLPIKNIESLKEMSPSMPLLSKLSKELDVIGVHAFTVDENDQVWCRNFAPACGIDEESATGTSNGALGAYLHDQVYGELERRAFTSFQGDWMGKPSRINVLTIKNEELEVWVGGKARISAAGTVSLPNYELNFKK